MNLNKMIEHFEEAKDHLMTIRDGQPDDETGRFCQWLVRTDINPFSLFADNAHASRCSTIEGLYDLCLSIRHAFTDDGSMSFVMINDTPAIVMTHPSDFISEAEFLAYVKSCDKAAPLRGNTSYKVLDITPDEFIKAREDYEVANLKNCFFFDGEFLGPDVAVKEYQDTPGFDPNWIEELKQELSNSD